MSWQALAWAGKLTVGSPAAKSLLILLANFADEAGECYPTFEKLSEMSELSYRAVQDNIAKLETLGLIERKRARNAKGHLGITRYRLCLDVVAVAIHRQEVPVELPATDASGHRQDVPVVTEGEPPATGAGQVNHQDYPSGRDTSACEGFEEFWKAYPKRVGDDPKKPAHAAYDRALARGATAPVLLAAAMAYRAKHPTPTRFVPRATTWLNEDRWFGDQRPLSAAARVGPVMRFIWDDGSDKRYLLLAARWLSEKGVPARARQLREGWGFYFPAEWVDDLNVVTAEAAA